MGKAIGIDLGTTNTAVAVMVDGRPRVLEDEKGYKVLPSCISLKEDGRFIVGQAARSLVITEPERTCFAVKRLMGRRYDSREARETRGRVAYNIVEGSDGLCEVQLVDQTFSPVELSALVLQVAKGIAERAIDDLVDEAVITVPAYFNHAQRSATMEAARLAGLHCERLLNEPTAAALAYGFRKQGEKTIVVYDLGGGTFDVSVLHISQGVYEILATRGDTYLGGEDFDFRLVDYLADQFQSAHGVDLREDRAALQRVKDAAERAKCELSFTDRTTVLVPRVVPSANLEVAVSRLTLEGLVEDLVDRTLKVTRQAINESGLQFSDIDDVILVGGQTRMPRVREAITGLFGKQPSRGVHPEEVVAVGAAVHAASLTEADVHAPLLLDVTPFDLGIDVAGGLFQPIVARNNHVPAAASRVFATSRDNQSSVRIRVRQGDSRFAAENEFLGEFVLGGLTPGPRMQTKVEVTFRIDMNGMLHCSAMEPGTGERKEITVRNYAQYAKGDSGVPLDVRGDKGDPGASEEPVMAANGAAEDGEASAAGESPGLFDRIFGRRPKAAGAPKPEGEATPATPAAPEVPGGELPLLAKGALQPVELAEDELVPLSDEHIELAPSGPRIDLAVPMALPDDLDELDELDELDDLDDLSEIGEAQLVEPEHDDGFRAASIGIAGGGVDGWRPEPPNGRGDQGGTDPFDLDGGLLPLGQDDATLPPPQDDIFGSPLDLHDDAPAPFASAPAPLQEDSEDDAFAMPVDEDYEQATGPIDVPLDADDEEPGGDTEIFARPKRHGGGLARPQLAPDEEDLLPSGDEEPTRVPRPSRPSAPRRKPARLKLSYRKADSLVSEYRENLRRGGCFVKTKKPLPVGRECRIEVRAPGLDEPIKLSGVVTWSSADLASLPPGQDAGMGIEYRMDEHRRLEIERLLTSLAE